MNNNFQSVREFYEKNRIAAPKPAPIPATKPRELSFSDLVGRHTLYGVDFDVNGVGNGIRFILDGVTYEVTEDEADGYRSSHNPIVSTSQSVFNRFPGVKVVVSFYETDSKDMLVIRDAENGQVVIEVGTDNLDDYYPSFVHNFNPENMSINQKEKNAI